MGTDLVGCFPFTQQFKPGLQGFWALLRAGGEREWCLGV